MRLGSLVISVALVASASAAHAEQAPDPLFGDNAHAKAVLDCHADYASRFSKAITSVNATPTEIATAAYAHCIGQINAFAQAVAETARTSNDARIMTGPEKYQAEQMARMRDYAFAYALDTYLKSTTAF